MTRNVVSIIIMDMKTLIAGSIGYDSNVVNRIANYMDQDTEHSQIASGALEIFCIDMAMGMMIGERL
ncbi:hypothetical protein Cpir12675_001002 [Ceratocystis pirilliformis]|uniref:Uncharacterized protein n=1 Tax=Ceratocystis pirilliformis TaxID=259994 RepID=A0ABR3ZHX0_9PEZI